MIFSLREFTLRFIIIWLMQRRKRAVRYAQRGDMRARRLMRRAIFTLLRQA